MCNEIVADRYEIERSADGAIYSRIGVLNATNLSLYAMQDAGPVSGFNYYRLKITDKDGKYFYSAVLTIHIDKSNAVMVYPNPAKNIVYVKLPENLFNKKVTMSLRSMDGKLLFTDKMFTTGQTAIIDVSKFANGKYYIHIATNADVINKLIEVIR